MFINVPIAGIVITGGVVFLSSHVTEARQRVDWAGAALGGLGLFAVVYGFVHAATKPGSAGWADPQTIGSIAAGIVLLAAFVIDERRVAYPLLPPRRRCELHHRERHERGSLAGARRTGGGAQLHRRVLGRSGDLDSRGTGRRALAATGLG
jgi:hypothetical protein